MWRFQDKNPALVESHYFGGLDLQLVIGLGSAMLSRVYEVQCHIKLLRWKASSTLYSSYRLAEGIAGEELHSEFPVSLCAEETPEGEAAEPQPPPADGAAAPEPLGTARPGAPRSARPVRARRAPRLRSGLPALTQVMHLNEPRLLVHLFIIRTHSNNLALYIISYLCCYGCITNLIFIKNNPRAQIQCKIPVCDGKK